MKLLKKKNKKVVLTDEASILVVTFLAIGHYMLFGYFMASINSLSLNILEWKQSSCYIFTIFLFISTFSGYHYLKRLHQ